MQGTAATVGFWSKFSRERLRLEAREYQAMHQKSAECRYNEVSYADWNTIVHSDHPHSPDSIAHIPSSWRCPSRNERISRAFGVIVVAVYHSGLHRPSHSGSCLKP